MISFIHTADIHFGMENYGSIDPATGIHSRLLDFNKALNFCIDYAIDHKVDFFLFSGDAYKTTNPSPTQQRLLMKSFLRLHEAGIPIIIIVGNHDHPLSFGKANALSIFGDVPISNFHVISKPTTIMLQTTSGPVQIVGIPWPTRNTITMAQTHLHKTAQEITEQISEKVALIIEDFAQKLDPTIPAVLGGHLTVSSGIFSGSEKRAIYGTDPVLLPSQLALPIFDYVGLGHLHRHQNLNPHGYPAVVYSGSIERIDFGERKEAKGFCHVTIKEKGTTDYQFIPTPTRPFVQLDVMLSPGQPQTEQIIQKISAHDITGSIIKILYHLPPSAKDHVDIRAIEAACIQAHYVVGITPIRSEEPKQRRIAMKVDMDLPTLLDTYFSSKDEFKESKNILIAKVLELEQEVANNEIDKEG